MKFKELKEKWWFRLIKVIYIFCIIIFSITLLILGKDDLEPKLDKEETKIICPNIEDPLFIYPESHITYKYNDFDFELSHYSFSGKKLMYEILMSGYSDIPNKILTKCLNKTGNYYIDGKKHKLKILDNNELYSIQKQFELIAKGYKNNEFEKEIQLFNNMYKTEYEKQQNLSFDVIIFDIIPVYKYTKTFINLFTNILIILISIILTRGIFYYIVIGDFFPKKQKH